MDEKKGAEGLAGGGPVRRVEISVRVSLGKAVVHVDATGQYVFVTVPLTMEYKGRQYHFASTYPFPLGQIIVPGFAG
jgi:hypothetical protein